MYPVAANKTIASITKSSIGNAPFQGQDLTAYRVTAVFLIRKDYTQSAQLCQCDRQRAIFILAKFSKYNTIVNAQRFAVEYKTRSPKNFDLS